jgi:hypothetical protein
MTSVLRNAIELVALFLADVRYTPRSVTLSTHDKSSDHDRLPPVLVWLRTEDLRY